MIMPCSVLGGKGYILHIDKVKVALVCDGDQDRKNTESLLMLDDVQIVSVTDPGRYWDLNRFYYKSLAGREPVTDLIEEHYKNKGESKKVQQYRRFSELMDNAKDVDAILCATPD